MRSMRQMTPQCKLTDYVSLPQMETIIAPHVVHEVLTRCEAWEEREKKSRCHRWSISS